MQDLLPLPWGRCRRGRGHRRSWCGHSKGGNQRKVPGRNSHAPHLDACRTTDDHPDHCRHRSNKVAASHCIPPSSTFAVAHSPMRSIPGNNRGSRTAPAFLPSYPKFGNEEESDPAYLQLQSNPPLVYLLVTTMIYGQLECAAVLGPITN